MSIIDEYLRIQKKYEKKYGKGRTIVLMQVGSFHESYSTETDGPDLRALSSLLNIVVTKKNKTINEVSLKNPLMLGFPSLALEKFVNILIDNNFTVIVIDQVTEPPKPKREVTNIYSPGTYIENATNNADSNYIVSIYIQEESQINNNKKLLCIGLSCIDLSIGNNIIYEVYSKYQDKFYGLDETVRFINSFNPKEILLTINGGKNTKNIKNNDFNKEVIDNFNYTDLLIYLNINNKIIHLISDKYFRNK